ncbi:MAG: GGDEF domain-containing protein [Thermodesulfobacteriota bacterium]
MIQASDTYTANNLQRDPLEAEIEKTLRRPAGLRFSPVLERQYIYDTIEHRFGTYRVLGWFAVALFNLFAISDYVLTPDIYPVAWIFRFTMATPMMIAAMVLASRQRFRRYIIHLLTFLFFMGGASLLLLAMLSRAPNAGHSYTGVALIIMFAAIVIRIPFWHAAVLGGSLLSLHLAVFSWFGRMPPDLMVHSALVIFSVGVISLLGNYRMEREFRRAYLRAMKMKIDARHLEKLNRQLEELAVSDPLTGLFNRRHFDVHLAAEWRSALREQLPISLIFIDIDHFKPYNDHYGHPAGDACLKQIAGAITENVHRPGDASVRYGGEEFVVLLANTGMAQALHVAQKIQAHIQALTIPHESSPVSDCVTVSMGVASTVPVRDDSPFELLERADHAMYAAKTAGRNRICVYGQPC